MNVISLWKCREAVSRATGATSHGNCHSLTIKVPDVSLLMKHMIDDSFFQEQLGWMGLRNNRTEYAFRDLFAKGVARIFTGMEIGRYVQASRGNWNNYNPDDAGDPDNEDEDDENGNIRRRPPEDPDEFYGVSN